jgi:hypothetical protein
MPMQEHKRVEVMEVPIVCACKGYRVWEREVKWKGRPIECPQEINSPKLNSMVSVGRGVIMNAMW